MKANARLINAWVRNRDNPRTFLIPPMHVLRDLQPGDLVKLGVELTAPLGNPIARAVLGNIPLDGGERFWVRVNSLVPAPMVGIVEQADMALTRVHGVSHGDTVMFHPHHILKVRKAKDPDE